MRSINRILIVFLSVTTLFVFLSWQFIQSEMFSGFVSEKVSKQLEKKLNVNASFDRLEFQFWPPQTKVHSLKLSHEESSIKFEAESVSLKFSLLSMLERELVVDTLEVQSGEVFLGQKIRSFLKEREEEEASENDQSLVDKIKKGKSKYEDYYELVRATIDEEAPFKVRGLVLENFTVVGDNREFEVKSFEFIDFAKSFKVRGLVEDVKILQKISNHLNISIDSLEFGFQLSEGRVRILDFVIFSQLSYLKTSGTWGLDSNLELHTHYKGGIRKLFPLLGQKYSKLIDRGYSDIKVDVFGGLENPEINFDADIIGIESPHMKMQEVSIAGGINNWIVSLHKAKSRMGDGTTSLKQREDIFDINKGSLLAEEVNISLNNVHTNDLLYFLKEDLSVLKGKLNGDVSLGLSEDKLNIFISDKFEVADFRLVNEETMDSILSKDSFFLDPSFIQVNLKNETVKMDMGVNLESSYLPFKGEVGNDKVNFELEETVVNLAEISPISGVPLSGSGVVDLSIQGPVDNVLFDFGLDVENFRVLGLRLGHLKGPLQLNLDTMEMRTSKIEVKKRETNYTLRGGINFEPRPSQENLDLQVDIMKGTYGDFIDLLHPITRNMDFLTQGIEYSFSGEAKLGGYFKDDAIRVQSHVEGVDFAYLGEDLDRLEMDIKYSNNKLELKQIKAEKGRGDIKGNFSINTETESLSYEGSTSGVFLSDFDFYKMSGLGLEAEIVGKVQGDGTFNDFVSDHHFELKGSNVLGKELPPSELNILTSGEYLTISGFVLGETFTFDSRYYYKHNTKQRSHLNANFNIQDMRNFLGAISSHNLRNESLKGAAQIDLKSDFKSLDFKDLSLELGVHEFSLSQDDFNLVLEEQKRAQGVKIRNGQISRWDVSFVGDKNNFFHSRGNGHVTEGLTIRTDSNIKARLLGILTDKVRDANGDINIESIVSGRINSLTHLTHLKGRGVQLRAQQLPGLIGNGVFDIVVDNDEVLIQNLDFDYGKGSISANGNIRFAFPYPVFSINWKVENATVPILSKSQVNISGSGQLIGEKVPYMLRGNIQVLHGNIVESLEDFRKSSGQLETYSRFIPKRQALSEANVLEFDITVNTMRPVLLKNSLAELYLRGNARIHGVSYSPLYTGRIEVVPEKSKFKFKGHEFLLSEGSIDLRGEESNESPLINFDGVAEVNQYDVFLEVSGPADTASVVMTSDPPLGKEDILSLLTLGVTTNVSQELGESERQSITTIGVGTLLFEQFKINEGISSSLGLRLSISPEVSENEDTLLQGKSAISENGATRIKSATKIQVQKQISEKVDLSVSSTVGGTLEQKQEMNLNYQLNDIFSVEGVYEVKSGEEHATDTPDSAGADLKWRWSF